MDSKIVQGSDGRWTRIWIDADAGQCRTNRRTPCDVVQTTCEAAQRQCADIALLVRPGYRTRESAEAAISAMEEAEAAIDRAMGI